MSQKFGLIINLKKKKPESFRLFRKVNNDMIFFTLLGVNVHTKKYIK